MHVLNERLTLYEPISTTRGETGQRLTPTYRRHYVHAKLMAGGGQIVEDTGLVVSDDRRRYIVRWRNVSTRWFGRDNAGNWYQVVSFQPVLAARRKSYLVIALAATTNPNLTLEDNG